VAFHAGNGTLQEMKTPQVGQRVWADGLKGTFIVVAVHPTQSLADLQLTDGTQATEKHVPFGMIHGLGEDFSQGAARIVKEFTEGR
jgi:hypothetical protein